MIVKLTYGKHGLEVDLPDDDITIVSPKYQPPVADAAQALRQALRQPIGTPLLRQMVKSDQRVAIVFSDLTRPQPRQAMLTALLQELSHLPDEQITLINGLGTHRPNTPAELTEMLGAELVGRFSIVQSVSTVQEGMLQAGMMPSGKPLYVNRDYVQADFKILTGFIEPHLFAGFSGGPKGLLPGITDLDTTMANHNYARLASPQATWGITHDNPVWEEMLLAAKLAGVDFLFNVAINCDQQITAIFAGDLEAAHAAGVDYVRRNAMAAVPQAYDLVITTNSGYPLDLNLYQGIKGISAAAQIVKPGGAILLAAECSDGIPEHGEFGALLKEAGTPQRLLEIISQPGYQRQDQWQAQILAQTLLKAQVYLYSDHLSARQIRDAMIQPCDDIIGWVAGMRERCRHASLCVMPEGPMTIPYLA